MATQHHHPDSCPTCGAGATLTPDGSWIADQVLFDAYDVEPKTVRMPAIGKTVRRRPPVPNVRELRGSELLRALADELDREELGDEQL